MQKMHAPHIVKKKRRENVAKCKLLTWNDDVAKKILMIHFR